MKKLLSLMVLSMIVLACSKNNYENTEAVETSEIEKIAEAHGIDAFEKIERLQYTFNVERDSTVIVSRTWIWDRTSGEITSMSNEDTTTYTRTSLNEALKNTDHRFINDKYWLLFPFQLIWDSNMTYTNAGLQNAPISGQQMTKLTIQYGNEGGYTPGDAYDLYLDEGWIIREWEFRKGGKEGPGSMVTWEDYISVMGIKVATNHQNKDGNFRLFFTDIKFD